MKKFYAELEKGQIAAVYLFYGDEPVLMDEAVAALSAAVLPQPDDWSRELFDGETSGPAAVVAAAQAGNFFGGRRLIVVKGIGWLDKSKNGASEADGGKDKKSLEDELALLIDYCGDPNPDTCLVLLARGAVDKRRKLVQTVQKKGRLVECNTPKGGEKEIWLSQRFRAQGKKADKQALGYISLSAATLSQMAAEVDKLCLYVGERPEIKLADAEAVVSKSSIFSIFELTDAAAAKNAARAVGVYQNLLTQGEAEQKIFASLAGHFRNLLAVQDLQQQGRRGGELAQTLGLHPFVASKCAKQADQFNQAQLIKALEIFLAADLAQKNGLGEMRTLLETAILRICAM